MKFTDPPSEKLDAWDDALGALKPGGIATTTQCPVCEKMNLFRYYHRHRGDRGGMWVWCANCGSYEHGSAIIPAWWEIENLVPERMLEHNPESFVERLTKNP